MDYLRDGDTLLVTKLDRLARSTSDLYRIISQLADKGVEFKVLDDPAMALQCTHKSSAPDAERVRFRG